MLKDSPQPHVPFMLGLLKTNSAASLSSTKSISVPETKINIIYICLLCHSNEKHAGMVFSTKVVWHPISIKKTQYMDMKV